MLIDTHCHIDQFESPEEVVHDCEKNGLRVVAVTNLPSHFAVAVDRLRDHKFLSAALGMHPLSANKGIRELSAFKRMAAHVNFIGEIGLDFSRQGIATKSLQIRLFEEVLSAVQDRPRFITLHSKGAESAVLNALCRHGISSAVFHWYSGSADVLDAILANGHFVSINPAMLSSINGKRVIAQVPRDRILIESDAPFTKYHGQVCSPMSVTLVYQRLASHWDVSFDEVVFCVKANFARIVNATSSISES